MAGAELDDVDGVNTLFIGATVTDATFKRAKLLQAIFKDANVARSDFSRADLRQTVFHHAQCQGAVFESVDLTEADLSHADVSMANFTDANLFRTRLHCIIEERALFGPSRAAALGTDEQLAKAERFEPGY